MTGQTCRSPPKPQFRRPPRRSSAPTSMYPSSSSRPRRICSVWATCRRDNRRLLTSANGRLPERPTTTRTVCSTPAPTPGTARRYPSVPVDARILRATRSRGSSIVQHPSTLGVPHLRTSSGDCCCQQVGHRRGPTSAVAPSRGKQSQPARLCDRQSRRRAGGHPDAAGSGSRRQAVGPRSAGLLSRRRAIQAAPKRCQMELLWNLRYDSSVQGCGALGALSEPCGIRRQVGRGDGGGGEEGIPSFGGCPNPGQGGRPIEHRRLMVGPRRRRSQSSGDKTG